MTCPNCGELLENMTRYCTNCGQPLQGVQQLSLATQQSTIRTGFPYTVQDILRFSAPEALTTYGEEDVTQDIMKMMQLDPNPDEVAALLTTLSNLEEAKAIERSGYHVTCAWIASFNVTRRVEKIEVCGQTFWSGEEFMPTICETNVKHLFGRGSLIHIVKGPFNSGSLQKCEDD